MLVFLVSNKKQPLITNAELYDWVIKVATNELSREQLAELLKTRCTNKSA